MAKSPVLVLDDDPETARVVARVLGPRGFEITFTPDPEEALRTANRIVPDLLVVDATQARLRGPHLIRVLRTRSATALIPAIFLGERKAVEEQIIGFKLGADAILSRPLRPQELDEQVRRAAREREKAETSIRPNPGKGEFTVSPMHSAFRGNLEELALPSLLTLLEMERKTGMLVLILQPEDEKARLYLRRGQLVRARLDGRDAPRGADLVCDLLPRTRGKFDFRTQKVDDEDEIRTATASLLLEGARRLDETRRQGS